MASLSLVDEAGVGNIKERVLALGDRSLSRMDAFDVGIVGPREREYRSYINVLDLCQDWLEYLATRDVRVSFSMFNTEDDVDRLVDLIGARLSSRSP